MTAGHDALRELAVGYAFGTMDASERREFERHLRTCTDCQQEVGDAALLAEGLALVVDGEAPPAGLKDRVLRSVSATLPVASRAEAAVPVAGSATLPTWLAIAASLVAIVAVGAAWNINRRSAAALADMRQRSEAALVEVRQQSAAALAEANQRMASVSTEASRQTESATAETGRQSAALADARRQLVEANQQSAAALSEAQRRSAEAIAETERQSAARLADASRESALALAEVERRAAAAVAEANRQTALVQAEVDRQRQVAGTMQQALAREQADGVEMRREVEIATAPDVRRIALAGQPAAPRATGRVFWSPTRGLLLTAANLPPLPAGRVYQLWYVTAAAPVSAGLVTPDASGQSLITSPTNSRVQPKAFALTIEPAGGVPAPTGAFYLLGSL